MDFFIGFWYNEVMPRIPENIKKYFWEADRGKLDLAANSVYITKRLIELGRPEAIKWAWKNLSRNDWQVALRSRDVSSSTKNFWQSFLAQKND